MIILFIFVALFSCAKEQHNYDVSFVQDIVVDSCTSVNINIQITLPENVSADKTGILWSLCEKPLLTDPSEDENGCQESPRIYVTNGALEQFAFNLTGEPQISGYGFIPGIPYYLRSFTVIDNVPYYGPVIKFGCQ